MTREWDWERAALAIKHARESLGFHKQADFAAFAGVDRNTIVNLEGARTYRRTPSSAKQVERALGWPEGTIKAIAEGAEAPPAVPLDARDGGPRQFASGMPLGVQESLSAGRVLETDVVRLGDDGEFVGILKIADREGVDRQRLGRVMEAWADFQRQLHRIADEESDHS